MSPDEYELATMNTVQDDAVMAGASGAQAVAVDDGRTRGDRRVRRPRWVPGLFAPWHAGLALWRARLASAYASVGARVITYDRPSYGGSDRFRGRRVVDCVADVSAIADSLGIERFAVSGGS
jgi:pimeloyl-ACP methyl ester carboxylesterase